MGPSDNSRILAAELVGTLVLMLGGPGVAILLPSLGLLPEGDASTGAGLIKILIIALGFGLSLLIMSYVIGPISGCHINPAVTLGMRLARKIPTEHAVYAWIGQIIGGVGGAAIIYGIASGRDGFQRGQFAANLWSGKYYGLGSAIVAEVLLTGLLVMVLLFTTTKKFAPGMGGLVAGHSGLLVMVLLFTTTKKFAPGMGGLVAGLTLTLIHIISIPVDNTSVNPARSLGTALFADTHTEALQQLWAFIVFPLIGAVLGVIVWLMLDDSRFEQTALGGLPGSSELREVLNSISDAVDVSDD